MDWHFWTAQTFGAVALVLCILGLQFKKKDQVILFYLFANIFISAEYFLLGSLVGGIINGICVIRNTIFYVCAKRNKPAPIWSLVVLEIAIISSGIFGWQNWWSLIPIVVAAIYTFGCWQDNVLLLKITAAISGAGWATFGFISKAYVGAIQETIIFISAICAIYVILSKQKHEKFELQQFEKKM